MILFFVIMAAVLGNIYLIYRRYHTTNDDHYLYLRLEEQIKRREFMIRCGDVWKDGKFHHKWLGDEISVYCTQLATHFFADSNQVIGYCDKHVHHQFQNFECVIYTSNMESISEQDAQDRLMISNIMMS
jgi:hypothetical protein